MEVAGLLAGLAETAIEAIGDILALARIAANEALSHMVIEVRLDADNYALRQILITPIVGTNTKHGKPKEPLKLPKGVRTALTITASFI